MDYHLRTSNICQALDPNSSFNKLGHDECRIHFQSVSNECPSTLCLIEVNLLVPKLGITLSFLRTSMLNCEYLESPVQRDIYRQL
jgi:hypothetical protein